MVCLGYFVVAWWFSAQQRKGVGGLFGLLPAVQILYMSTQTTGQTISEAPIGIVTALYIVGCMFAVWRNGAAK